LQNVPVLNKAHSGFEFWRQETVGPWAGNGFAQAIFNRACHLGWLQWGSQIKCSCGGE
jgi:hypothetical protein